MADDFLDYKIGSTLGTMQTIAQLGLSSYPQATPVHFADYVETLDGHVSGQGMLKARWRFAFMTKADLAALRPYCAEPATSAAVYIKTLKSAGGMDVYTAIMVWPQVEPADEEDCYSDVIFDFRLLVHQAST